MMNILVCDDSREDLESVSKIVENFYKNTAATAYSISKFSDPIVALSYVREGNPIDIAIMDIMMPQMNGLELAEKMREIGFEGYLIFLSTSNNFAAQSYSVKAFSYILKPAIEDTVSEMLTAIEKARGVNEHSGFSLTRRSGIRYVLNSEFMYVEVINHQLHFHLIDGEVIKVYATLKEYSEILLAQPQMIKPQKSYIVNLDYVRSCENRAIFMRDGVMV